VRAQTAPTHHLRAGELLTSSPDAERHASWLELFFDLVFVLALTGITGRLSGPTLPTGSQIGIALASTPSCSGPGSASFLRCPASTLTDVPHRLLVLVAHRRRGRRGAGTRQSIDCICADRLSRGARGADSGYLRSTCPTSRREVVPVYLVDSAPAGCCGSASLALPVMIRPAVWIAASCSSCSHRGSATNPVPSGEHLPFP